MNSMSTISRSLISFYVVCAYGVYEVYETRNYGVLVCVVECIDGWINRYQMRKLG